MQRLSSLLTFFYKYVFITLWTGVFGFGFYNVYQSPNSGEMPVKLIIMIIVLVSVIFYFAYGRIKRVQLEGSTLRVSNYFDEIEIDLSEIKSVHGSILLSPELVWFKLHEPSMFGSTIIFMPKARFFAGYSKHPMVAELKELASI